jgi:hypothetical protein
VKAGQGPAAGQRQRGQVRRGWGWGQRRRGWVRRDGRGGGRATGAGRRWRGRDEAARDEGGTGDSVCGTASSSSWAQSVSEWNDKLRRPLSTTAEMGVVGHNLMFDDLTDSRQTYDICLCPTAPKEDGCIHFHLHLSNTVVIFPLVYEWLLHVQHHAILDDKGKGPTDIIESPPKRL